ncbi:ATP-binding protein [Flaviflexus massiliensis]|uniref:ATP-binding protein n=1 Tax=Flaviflexus massiliensis TaxID=1522309 RepID=UPI0006D56926|nr:ATP-binding protein [Flaviflexus massiliensis]
MTHPHGIIIGEGPIARDIAALLVQERPQWRIEQAGDATGARTLLSTGQSPAFIITCLEGDGGDAAEGLMPLVTKHSVTRSILVTSTSTVTGLERLIDEGRVDLIVHGPSLKPARFLTDLSHQVRRFEDRVAREQDEAVERESFIFALPDSDDEIMAKIVAGIDDLLGFQPRIQLPAGVRLTREGEPAEEATLCLSGQVALERESHAGNVLMHHASTGRIIGLLSLTDQRHSFFTSRTTTDVTGIRLTFEQLNYVIRTRPEIELLIAVLLIRSLDRRLRRAEEIQIEKVELTARLEKEQRELRATYQALEQARAELMSQARLATLGELASGVAHEVNNPIAAIIRTVDHLGDGIADLMGHLGGEAGVARLALDRALTSKPVSTREARALKRTFTELTGDPARANRLVLAEVDEETLMALPRGREDLLDVLETAASIGTGLRNLRSASTRISSLVDSLRSHARPDGDPLTDVDLNENIDDALRLLSHRLKDIEIVREFSPLHPITCHPGQLSQVWTNLLTNAADAVADLPHGQLTITADSIGEDWVRVTIRDNGPGIPPDLRDHIFEPRFTTKAGRVQYGMGLGLTISKTIVERHGGRLTLDSTSAGTVATVELPREGP